MKGPAPPVSCRELKNLEHSKELTDGDPQNKEPPDNVKILPDEDPRTLERLIMNLPKGRFEALTRLLKFTPNLTATEVRNLILEEESKQAARRERKTSTEDKSANQSKKKGNFCDHCQQHEHPEVQCRILHPELLPLPHCNVCEKIGHGKDTCWAVHPEKAPAWYQNKLKKRCAACGKLGHAINACWVYHPKAPKSFEDKSKKQRRAAAWYQDKLEKQRKAQEKGKAKRKGKREKALGKAKGERKGTGEKSKEYFSILEGGECSSDSIEQGQD